MKAEGGRQDLRLRTKEYALRIIRLYQALPRGGGVAQVLGKQLLRSGTSVAAHDREACRAKSNLDFISKLKGAQQELDESDLWLELLADSSVLKPALVAPLREETNELLAVFVTMTNHVKQRHQ
ncbi:MAG TPA: four helix bundle protein [Chthoniobacterales bacterium]|nr:four helix bundle protein [Chthoniobacterales bacterium]